MKARYAIAYAYPTSTNAKELGFDRTGCYYVEEQVKREDGNWSTPSIAHNCEGFALKDDADLLSLLREYRGLI